MSLQKYSIRELVGALLRLNNISQGKAADRTKLQRQNVSSWYTGRDNAISQESQLRLLETLGILEGSLNSDVIHRWRVKDIEDVAMVLSTTLTDEDRVNAEIWPVKILSQIKCVVLRVSRPSETIWVLMSRPPMAEKPKPIDAVSLKFGTDMYEVVIDNATLDSWLNTEVLDPVAFNNQMTALIEIFPHPAVPQAIYDEMEEPGGENVLEASQEQVWESLVPTSEEIKEWNEVLLQAKLRGKSFDEIVKTTSKLLGISLLGSNKR